MLDIIIIGSILVIGFAMFFVVQKKYSKKVTDEIRRENFKKIKEEYGDSGSGSTIGLLLYPQIEIGNRISNLNRQLNNQVEENNKLLKELVNLQKENLELKKKEQK